MQTSKLYLPDTNILIAYFQGDSYIWRHMAGSRIYVSAIVAGELFYGAFNSAQQANNLSAFRAFLDVQEILPCDYATSERYGIIFAELEKRRARVRQNDVWVAAHALQYDLVVASRDAHFEPIQQALGLRLEIW